jgi:hypothetical protein
VKRASTQRAEAREGVRELQVEKAIHGPCEKARAQAIDESDRSRFEITQETRAQHEIDVGSQSVQEVRDVLGVILSVGIEEHNPICRDLIKREAHCPPLAGVARQAEHSRAGRARSRGRAICGTVIHNKHFTELWNMFPTFRDHLLDALCLVVRRQHHTHLGHSLTPLTVVSLSFRRSVVLQLVPSFRVPLRACPSLHFTSVSHYPSRFSVRVRSTEFRNLKALTRLDHLQAWLPLCVWQDAFEAWIGGQKEERAPREA